MNKAHWILGRLGGFAGDFDLSFISAAGVITTLAP
jgi:hypothetical protein